jgi:hypothetical protein
MQFRSVRAMSLLSAAAVSALAGSTFGAQYGVAGSVSVPLSTTDDTAAMNPITYNSAGLLVQTIQEATVPNGNFQGAGTPYLVGTFGSTTGTGPFSSSTTYTAYYYNPLAGLHFFGQYNSSSTDQYLGNGNTNSFNTPGGATVPLFTHTVNLTGENASGQVIANEGIEAPDTKTLSIFGRHAFQYSIATNSYVSLGLGGSVPSTAIGSSGASYGVDYTYTNTSSNSVTGVYSFANSANIDAAGDVSGSQNRFFAYGGAAQTSTTATLGTSTWFYNAATNATVETGLTGVGYSYARTFTGTGAGTGTFASNNDRGVNGGYSAGTATPYVDTGDSVAHSIGTEPWLYSSTTNTVTPVSLYQSGIVPSVAGSALTYSYSYPVSYNNSANTLTFSGNDRSGTIAALNSLGQVGGNSTLYQAASGSTSKGQDSFIYTPTTNAYQQVGLISNGFAGGGTSSFVSAAGARNSTLLFLNNAGASAGTSTQYVSASAGGSGNNSSSAVPWFTPAAGPTIQIGLTDSYHTANTSGYTYTGGGVSELTNTGLVAGTAARYAPGTASSLGTDPFIYDSNTGTTYDLDPFTNTPGSYFLGSVTYLSESGLAVGEYKTNSAAPYSAFEWSETGGFVDLTSATSLLYTPYQTLINAYSVDPTGNTIYVTVGTLNNGNATMTGIAVLSTAVPEPASLAVLAGAVALSCSRRRRVAVG